ncbi:pentraxin-related protein PTX3-like [Conger conger]|uniref:pentraxin-related protein PTX3-like n=1 Tax=Conger conger TaxID=82655 RepID=UPI002A5A3FD1|nr:pentraxin-related protein PTX3-like [Conger conger]
MSLSRVLLAACLLCGRLSLGYEDYQVTYDDSYYNEIPMEEREATPSAAPCQSQEASRWDKLFIALEDSHMRQNMLLHSLDAVVGAELRALAGDLRKVAGGNAAAWAGSADALANRVAAQLGRRVEAAAGRGAREAGAERSSRQEAALQRLLEAGRKQEARLDAIEEACRGGPGEAPLETTLAAMATELQRLQAQLDASQRVANQNFLPSGYHTGLLFPARSRFPHARAEAHTRAPLRSLTVCLWANPARPLNRTALFSYGRPGEARLLLQGGPGGAAVLSAGGEDAAPLEARGVVEERSWGHYCGSWSAERGQAALWADGRLVASSVAGAEAQALPAQGTFFLGGYEAHLPAFAGMMTGFNVWDRVLGAEEISQHARLGGGRGNVVAWGTSVIVPLNGSVFVT